MMMMMMTTMNAHTPCSSSLITPPPVGLMTSEEVYFLLGLIRLIVARISRHKRVSPGEKSCSSLRRCGSQVSFSFLQNLSGSAAGDPNQNCSDRLE